MKFLKKTRPATAFGLALLAVLSLCQAQSTTKSALQEEFQRREKLRLSPEKGQAMQFMQNLKFDTTKIIEFEMLDAEGRFLVRTSDDQVCMGHPAQFLLRCKNVIGLSTVYANGDAD